MFHGCTPLSIQGISFFFSHALFLKYSKPTIAGNIGEIACPIYTPENPISTTKVNNQPTGSRTNTASKRAFIIAIFAEPIPIAKESNVYIIA